MGYEDYQGPLVKELLGRNGRYKALVLPTGSGKTRIALRFAASRLEAGLSVAFLVESDLHAKQVSDEAEATGVHVRFIPGKSKVQQHPEKLAQRQFDLEDYGQGLFVGLFTYAGYFHGSNVDRAQVLIVDDAHALQSEDFSYASVSISEERFGEAALRKLRKAIGEAVPSIRPAFQDLVDPVQQGGSAILVPPIPASGKAAIQLLVSELSKTEGFHGYLLGMRLKACPFFLNWPLVVTKDTVVWQPFSMPFEALGQPAAKATIPAELLLITATAGPDRFLQARLGLDSPVEVVSNPGVPPMGSRVVLNYAGYGRGKHGLAQASKLIRELVKRFGAVVVTTTSGAKAAAIRKNLPSEIDTLTSKSSEEEDPVQRFKAMNTPKVLFLINRPSGVNIPSSICKVAVHLDLPYANDGHGVIAGAGGDRGRALDSSLAVRMSQLLGRLNRNESDRSVHFLIGMDLPLEKGGLFVRTVEKAALRDILAGQRVTRQYKEPMMTIDSPFLDAFLAGDESLLTEPLKTADTLVPRLTSGGVEHYEVDTTAAIEASRDLALGNWRRAFNGFQRLSQDARNQEQGDSQAFMALQALCAMDSTAAPAKELYPPDGRKSLLKDAAAAMATHPALLAALDAASQTEQELPATEKTRVKLRHFAIIQYNRLASEGLAIPDGEDAVSELAWTNFWREAFSQHDHETLQEHLSRALRLLGAETPSKGKGDNDLLVRWPGAPVGTGIAVEVKGRNLPGGQQESAVHKENIDQARENAYELRETTNVALLFTSKSKCEKGLREHAREGGVRLMLHVDGQEFARVMARHCVSLARVERHALGQSEIEYLIDDFHAALQSTPPGESPAFP